MTRSTLWSVPVAEERVADVAHSPGRAAATQARLRQAAREVFAEQGYAAARVADIVARAGVSHGTFYTYYVNKSAVLEDLVREAARRLHAIADDPWDGPDVRGALQRVIGRFVEVYADEAGVVRTWISAATVEPEFAALLRERRGGFVDRIADNLTAAGVARGHDPVVAASALVAMVEGFAVEHLPAASEEQRAATVRTLAALWHGGLAALDEGHRLPS